METTYNEEIFENGVTKTRDGRTRRQRAIEGEISTVQDTPSGLKLKNKN